MPTRTDATTGTTTRVHLDGSLALAGGSLAPRVLTRTDRMARVALVATGATLLGGDHVAVDLAVGPGQTLVVQDTGATVAYHGRGRVARVHARIHVATGGRLVWDAQPLVLANGADVERTLDIGVDDGGALLLRDTLVLGRVGEHGGALTCRTHAAYDNRPALVETLTLDDERHHPAMIGRHRIVDSALALGIRASSDGLDGAASFDLPEPGTLVRWLGADAHRSPVSPVWRTWWTGLVAAAH